MAARKTRKATKPRKPTRKTAAKKDTRKSSRKIPRGFPAKEAKAFLEVIKKSPYKANAISLCEGDYVCILGGRVYNLGDKSRILFVCPTCPNNTVLGDGSRWRYNGGCKC